MYISAYLQFWRIQTQRCLNQVPTFSPQRSLNTATIFNSKQQLYKLGIRIQHGRPTNHNTAACRLSKLNSPCITPTTKNVCSYLYTSCTNMYTETYICIYICMYTGIQISLCMPICNNICEYLYIYICMYTYVYMYKLPKTIPMTVVGILCLHVGALRPVHALGIGCCCKLQVLLWVSLLEPYYLGPLHETQLQC